MTHERGGELFLAPIAPSAGEPAARSEPIDVAVTEYWPLGAVEGEQSQEINQAVDSVVRWSGTYVRLVKPVVDFVGALLLILLTLPLLAAIAFGIRVTMGRPVIFAQTRVGRDGRRFTMFKFRTMVADRRRAQIAMEGQDRRRVHKSPSDPRVTRFGKFLRKWSLDEIPQFWNVLLGQMSLVGPRPEIAAVVEAKYLPWQHRRHVVKPGLTGLWQISDQTSELMLYATDIDLYYIQRLSLITDLRILFRTPLAALGHRRSAKEVLG